jgi:hypothetical protein
MAADPSGRSGRLACLFTAFGVGFIALLMAVISLALYLVFLRN